MSNVPDVHTSTGGDEDQHSHFYDTQQLRALSQGEQQTELLVLSGNSTLIDVVRTAAPGIVRVVAARDLDEASEMPDLEPGVLVVDVSMATDLAAMLPQLTQHFPEVVIIVAGKRDDVAALMRLTAAGRIFRFLLIPLGHGQTRLALGAAVAQHLGMKAANQRASQPSPAAARKNYALAYGALGIGAMIVVAGIWFGVRALTEEPAAPVSAAVQSAPLLPPADPVQKELQLANDAFAEGRYFEPRGDSALDLYRNVLRMDPANQAAQTGVRSVVDKILERAEQALTAERLEQAVQDIETARAIDATHPRLAFLDVQVKREHERLALDQARATTNRVRTLVEQAGVQIQQQRLLRPPGANANDTLQQARRLDPRDPAVELATRELSAALTEAARRAVAAGDAARARELIDAARKLGVTDAALLALERSLNDTTARTTALVVDTPQSPAGSNVAPRQAAPAAPAIIESRAPENPVQQTPVDEVLQASELKRTREVAADYPAQAALDGLEGWVDIDFTISETGVPQDLKVRDANPRRVFDRAAVNSLRQWRFEPIVENGVPVAKRATLRVRFQRRG